MRQPHAGIALVLLTLGCTSTTLPDVVGEWGGTQASMTLGPSGGTLNYQCGAGTIDSAWSLAAGGRFTASGRHYFGGGPLPSEGRPPHPARYTGQVEGRVLMLTVVLTDLSQTIGPFRLIGGGPVVHELCL